MNKMNKTLLSSLGFLGLFLALPPRSALAIEINTNSPAPAVVDMEDSADAEDEDDGCGPPSANDGPDGDGSPCEKNSAPGMAVWRVSEPYINLWLDDTPLRYLLAGGKWMELTLSYKQRGETREDFLDTFGPGWSCNWMGLAVRSNTPTAPIFLHKAGGGREIMITNQFSPRTLGEPVCCMAPCGWQSGVQINSPGGSSRIYTNTICSPFPDSASYLFRSFCADRYGRGTTYRWAGFNTNSTCYARLDTVVDRDGNTNVLTYTNFLDAGGHLLQRVSAVTDPYSRTARFFYDHNGRLTNITDTIGLVSSFQYDHTGVITNLHTDYGHTGFRHFETNSSAGNPLGRAIEINEPNGTKQLYVYRSELPSEAVGSYYTHDNVYPRYFNSFHWDRAQYAALSAQALTNYVEMPEEDFLKASLKHWLSKADGGLSDTLAAQAGPVTDFTSGPARINQTAYQYQGQQVYYLVGTAKRVTSVVWYASTVFQQLDIGRNTWGRPTSLTFYYGGQSYTYNNYFDADGRILQKVIGPHNELVRGYGYHADYTNLLTSVTNALYEVVRYTHDTNNLKMRLTSVTYPGGLVTTNFYNGSGFLERTIDVGIRTNSFAYQNGNLWYQTNELGLVTTNTWDNLGRLLSTHYPDGTYTSNCWDKLDVVGVRDRMGYWTRYAYNQVRQRTYETNANGPVTQYVYCDCGSPSEIIAWNGSTPVTTRFYHDIAGRMTNVVYPDNYSVTNTFDALSRLERITDSASRQATLSYNDYNQLIQVLVGQSTSQLTWLARQFDEYGRLTNSIDRNGVTTTNSFDELGRMLDRRTIGGDLQVQSGLETFE